MKRLMRSFSLSAAGLAALLLAVGQSAWAAPEVTLKLHHFLPAVSAAHKEMLVPWAERVEKDSGGRIEVEVYPSMSLGGTPPQLIRQLRDGVVDIIWTVQGYTPGLFPRAEA